MKPRGSGICHSSGSVQPLRSCDMLVSMSKKMRAMLDEENGKMTKYPRL